MMYCKEKLNRFLQVLEYKMSQYFGDVLMSAISTGLKNGTAILDERESQQDSS